MSSGLWGAMPFVGMVTAECARIGLTTLSKAAMLRGMSQFVFVVYSNVLATLLLLPSAFFFHRTTRPPLTFSLLCRFFLLGLISYVLQMLSYTGIQYSSPILGSAINNLIPAFTFLLAVIFRMEKLELRSSSSQAKSLGAMVSITGAFVVTLYKGPPIMITASPCKSPDLFLLSPKSNWVLGGFLIAFADFLLAIWNIIMAATVKEYPAEMTILGFCIFFGSIQATIGNLILERDPNAWRLRPDMELIAILYSAVFGCGFCGGVYTWCLHKKGPVYVTMFKPLGIIIAVVMGVIFLGDTLRLGSVVGATIIAIGFYGVMWGKAKEEKMGVESGVSRLESSTQKTPLLQTKEEEI